VLRARAREERKRKRERVENERRERTSTMWKKGECHKGGILFDRPVKKNGAQRKATMSLLSLGSTVDNVGWGGQRFVLGKQLYITAIELK